MTTYLYLIRHGETDWNLASRIQGHIDTTLNCNGLKQSQIIAQFLTRQKKKITHIYSSDLCRAQQTAQVIASALELTIQTYPALRERHCGFFEGLSYQEAENRYPDLFLRLKARQPDFAIPDDGESLLALQVRVVNQLKEWVEKHRDETIVIVTHGGVIDVINRLARQLPLELPRDFPNPNAGCHLLGHDNDNGWQIIHWAQTSPDSALDEVLC